MSDCPDIIPPVVYDQPIEGALTVHADDLPAHQADPCKHVQIEFQVLRKSGLFETAYTLRVWDQAIMDRFVWPPVVRISLVGQPQPKTPEEIAADEAWWQSMRDGKDAQTKRDAEAYARRSAGTVISGQEEKAA